MTQITPDAALDMLNAFLPRWDGGRIVLYAFGPPSDPTGQYPAGLHVSLTSQKELVAFPLASPAFGLAEIRPDEKAATALLDTAAFTPQFPVAEGDATFFRAYQADDLPLFQGTVSAVALDEFGGDLLVDDRHARLNIAVELRAFRLNQMAWGW